MAGRGLQLDEEADLTSGNARHEAPSYTHRAKPQRRRVRLHYSLYPRVFGPTSSQKRAYANRAHAIPAQVEHTIHSYAHPYVMSLTYVTIART